MSQLERRPSPEPVTPQAVYATANEILDTYGQPGTQGTLHIIKAPWRAAGIWPRRGPDIAITQAPVVAIERDGNEYKLWLQRRADNPQDGQDNAVRLSVHFQQFPYELDRVEHDKGGRVTGYWYKLYDREELQHVGVVRSGLTNLPRELELSWYIARSYSITPDEVKKDSPEQTREEIGRGLQDGNDFLLGMLKEMQGKLRG